MTDMPQDGIARVDASTALQIRQREAKTHRAISRLLDRLRKWIRVDLKYMDDHLPDHAICFVTGPDSGPELELLRAMKRSPEIWVTAIPKDLVLLPRREVEKLIAAPVILQGLEMCALARIESEAARIAYEEDFEG